MEVKPSGKVEGNQEKFSIKILTKTPIDQVDLAADSQDASGKVVLKSLTYAWQNIVSGKKLPIEIDKTYEDSAYIGDGAASATLTLQRVHYADGTVWTAPPAAAK